MRIRMAVRMLAVAAITAVAAGSAGAQSLTSVRGLGYPLLPVDARAEVLGGLGVGLKGLSAPFTNPAAAARVQRPGVLASVAAVEQTARLGDGSDQFGATRFPLFQVLYPVQGVVLTAGYGGYLDQSWGVIAEGEQETGGTTISYRDLVRSRGGIGQFQVGLAVPVSERLSFGAALGGHTGERQLEHQRQFDSTSLGDLQSFVQTSSVLYSGPMAQIGVQWDPVEPLRLAGSVTWAGTLTADSASGPAEGAEYDLPLQVAAGASAYLATGLLATASGRWSGWSSTGRLVNLEAGGLESTGRDTWELGAGLEWVNAAPRDVRTFPLRIGGSYRQLPFSTGERSPSEWFLGAGAGMRVGGDVENPQGRVDFTVQRGERTAPAYSADGTLTETAWRFSLSVALFGT